MPLKWFANLTFYNAIDRPRIVWREDEEILYYAIQYSHKSHSYYYFIIKNTYTKCLYVYRNQVTHQ